jgi:hypothetical protein
MISRRAISLLYMTICIFYSFLYAETNGISQSIQIGDTPPLFPKSYLLPQPHPLNNPLQNLFSHPHMFESAKELEKAGFQVRVSHELMVAAHPTIPRYFIKKFNDSIPQEQQLKNFIKRIEGAELLRNYIKKHHFKHLVVPKKWLYKLPASFPGQSYVLIVEKMDIYDDWENPQGEARKLYYHMHKEVLTELCTILQDLGGCDSLPRNHPLTRSGKIAFIDTEHVGEFKDFFYMYLVPALSPELQDYALTLWETLEEKG